MSRKNKIIIHRYKSSYRIDVYSNDECEEATLIAHVINSNGFTEEKQVFVSYDGDLVFNEKNIVVKQTDLRNPFRQKIWMNNDWIKAIPNAVYVQEYFNIYVYNVKYEWDMFLNNNLSNDSYIIQEKSLDLIISFGVCQPTVLYIRNDSDILNMFIEVFGDNGYRYKYPLIK